MRIWILASVVFVACFGFAKPASSGGCTEDRECARKELCHAGSCAKLARGESLLDVRLQEWVANASIYIDNVPMGNLPWEGVVSAGSHAIRVEAPGYQPLETTGVAKAQKRETIEVKLLPGSGYSSSSDLPPPPPGGQYDFSSSSEEGEPAQEDQGAPEGDKKSGKLAIGLHFDGGYGTAKWGSRIKRPAGSVFGGALFSIRFVEDPLWFELGLTGSYGAHFVKDWPEPDLGDVKVTELHLGLLPRIMFPLVDDFFYLGLELEAGMAISSAYYIVVQPRGDLAFLVNESFEIRINPLGFELLQEMSGKGAFIGYTANIGAAFRFR